MKFFDLMNRVCMEADGGASGAGDPPPADPPADDPAQSDGDGQKTGNEADILAKAQKIADAMVAKKLQGMPSKEEVAEWNKWKKEQQTAEEQAAEVLKAAETKQAELDARENALNAKLAAQTAGIKAEHIDDAVVLAMARVSDDVTLEAAMKDIAGKNAAWLAGVKLPEEGGNPAVKNDDKPIKEPPKLI